MSYTLTGSNSKKLLPQTSVNKDHVFLKKKKKSVFHHIKGTNFMFSEYPNAIRKTGQVDKHTDSEYFIISCHIFRCAQYSKMQSKTAQMSCFVFKGMFKGAL